MFFRFDDENYESNNDWKYTMTMKEYQLEQFSPTILNLKKHDANTLLYIFWFIMTLGQYKIIYLKKDDDLIHYTHILPKFFKLPFLGLNDLEIGPSWTAESYRGKGIFPMVIKYVVETFKEKGRRFYMFAHIDNISSQKAIKKAGFYMWATGYKTDFLGIYKVEV
ncbi:MAG: GNAT family N-acetyltransferase [Flavobacteriaceae bacterium]|nr:GNAT family N-acetyltransferase [Flavobacteriaceae bacterium]